MCRDYAAKFIESKKVVEADKIDELGAKNKEKSERKKSEGDEKDEKRKKDMAKLAVGIIMMPEVFPKYSEEKHEMLQMGAAKMIVEYKSDEVDEAFVVMKYGVCGGGTRKPEEKESCVENVVEEEHKQEGTTVNVVGEVLGDMSVVIRGKERSRS